MSTGTIQQEPIVFVGSSIMALWESLPRFFPGMPILNTAVSGSQTHEIYARLDELVTRHAPCAVCYYCGSNDINHDVPAQTIVQNVIRTYEALRRRLAGLTFIYLSIIKAPQKRDRWDRVEDVNHQLSEWASRSDGFHFVDINPVFFSSHGTPRMDFYEADQLHLMPAAYLALGDYLGPRVLALVRETRE
jgi:lysophospholipase L1-like esterase